jgi:Pentapeptide repeats (8 copies)
MKELSRFGATYYLGLTIEADPKSSPPKLTIDGHIIHIKKVGRRFVYAKGAGIAPSPTLSGLARSIIDILWDRKTRLKIRKKHIAELRKGRQSWSEWRRYNPEVRPMLFGAPLRGANLIGFNLCNANLIKADLRNAILIRTNFHEANLGGAKLNGANFRHANFCRTDLYETDLSAPTLKVRRRTDMTYANLQGTQLA